MTSVISCIQDIRKVCKDLNIAVTSILPRPCESHQYESWKKRANMQIQKLVSEMALEVVKSKEGCGVGFLDMDVLNTQMFARDGVHLNQEGD